MRCFRLACTDFRYLHACEVDQCFPNVHFVFHLISVLPPFFILYHPHKHTHTHTHTTHHPSIHPSIASIHLSIRLFTSQKCAWGSIFSKYTLGFYFLGVVPLLLHLVSNQEINSRHCLGAPLMTDQLIALPQ